MTSFNDALTKVNATLASVPIDDRKGPFGGKAMVEVLQLWNAHPEHIHECLVLWRDRIEEGAQVGNHQHNVTLWTMILALQDQKGQNEPSIDYFLDAAGADNPGMATMLMAGEWAWNGQRAEHILQSYDVQRSWLTQRGLGELMDDIVAGAGRIILSEAMALNQTERCDDLLALLRTHCQPTQHVRGEEDIKEPWVQHWLHISKKLSVVPQLERVLDALVSWGVDLDERYQGRGFLWAALNELDWQSSEIAQRKVDALLDQGATCPMEPPLSQDIADLLAKQPRIRRERLGQVADSAAAPERRPAPKM